MKTTAGRVDQVFLQSGCLWLLLDREMAFRFGDGADLAMNKYVGTQPINTGIWYNTATSIIPVNN